MANWWMYFLFSFASIEDFNWKCHRFMPTIFPTPAFCCSAEQLLQVLHNWIKSSSSHHWLPRQNHHRTGRKPGLLFLLLSPHFHSSNTVLTLKTVIFSSSLKVTEISTGSDWSQSHPHPPSDAQRGDTAELQNYCSLSLHPLMFPH